jgi:hypothetical protein
MGQAMAGLTVRHAADSSPAGLAAALRERAPAWLPGAGGVVAVRAGRSRRYAYSTIHRVEVRFADGSRRNLVVKVFPDAEVQFLALRSVWPAFADHSTWRIPQPLAVLEAGPALVMTVVDGRTAHERLPYWCARAARPEALADARRIAGWLRFYHDTTGAGHTRLDVSARIADAEVAVARLAALGAAGPWSDQVRRRLDRLGTFLEGRTLPAARVHGEFTVDNVVLHGGCVGALDLWGRDENAVHHDVASFVNSLWLMRLTRPGLGPAAIDALGRAFVDAYFGPRDDRVDRRAVAFLQIVGLIDAALEVAGRRRARLARFWLGRVIGGAMTRLASREDLA